MEHARVIRRWINHDRGRYYLVVVTDDLFGGWNLMRFWGGCDSRRGGQCAQHIEDPKALAQHLHRIALRRRQRAYLNAYGGFSTRPDPFP